MGHSRGSKLHEHRWGGSREDGGKIESMEGAKLLLYTDGYVTKARDTPRKAIQVVGHGDPDLCPLQETITDSRFGEIHRRLSLAIGDEKAVFNLEGALWDDDAGICHGRSISGNGDLGVRSGLGAKGDPGCRRQQQGCG